jgi:hypothetical protein
LASIEQDSKKDQMNQQVLSLLSSFRFMLEIIRDHRTLLFKKLQALFGSEFGLVDAVAYPDPAVGAAGEEETG